MAYLSKPRIADAVDQEQLLRPAKASVLFAIFDYVAGIFRPYMRYRLKLLFARRIYIYRVGRNCSFNRLNNDRFLIRAGKRQHN